MRILIIGATGFIGPHLVEQLSHGAHTLAVYHRGTSTRELPADVTHIIGDRRRLEADANQLRAFAPDIVIDLILSSGAQAHAMMQVFEGVAHRVVAISSMDVYRACGILHRLEDGPLEQLPLRETSPLRSKLQTYPEAQLRMLQQTFGWLDDDYDKIPVERAVLGEPRLPGTILRLPMIYGPGDPLHRLFPLLKRVDDRRPAILLDEELAQWRGPRGYVENVAAAIALATVSEQAAGRVYNVAEPIAFSEHDWARDVAAAAGYTGQVVVIPSDRAPAHLKMAGNLAQHWVPDTTRIRRELGYIEPISRAEALRRTIAWERANPPAQINPAIFDYEAEDHAVASQP
jgi:nucleoside-diphosphate-sugar epimerase